MTPESRLGDVLERVIRQRMRDEHVSRIALIDDGSPESKLLRRILGPRLEPETLINVSHDPQLLDSLLHGLGPDYGKDDVAAATLSLRARLVEDSIAASPLNKTALLLGGSLPAEPILPLGDVYASEVEQLSGDWSAPEAVRELARLSGGIVELDRILGRWAEGRESDWAAGQPASVRDAIGKALATGRASRISNHVVPKLGRRTLTVDLTE